MYINLIEPLKTAPFSFSVEEPDRLVLSDSVLSLPGLVVCPVEFVVCPVEFVVHSCDEIFVVVCATNTRILLEDGGAEEGGTMIVPP